MEKYDFKFKKKYGQNFLKDTNIVKKIVNCADILSNSLVLEVGPGAGIMTKELANVADFVVAYEIDKDLDEQIRNRLSGVSNVDVIYKDFLNADLSSDLEKYNYDNLYFVSNVPYYITTPIIMKLISSKLNFKKIVMMVQKEVGDRFSAFPGGKEYGSITVLLNYFYDIKREFNVSRKQFIPEPNVDSVIISFTEKKNKLFVKDLSKFQKIVRDSFQFKRKNIKNNLKNYNLDKISSILSKYGYDLNVRAEQLELEVFVDIANSIF